MIAFDNFNSMFLQRARGKQLINDEDESTLLCELMKICENSNELDYSHHDLSANMFLINLYELMRLSKDHTMLRTCVEILAIAIENEHNRLYLVNKMHFMPLLSNILSTTNKRDLKKSALTLIQKLSSNITIKCNDGYIGTTLKYLASMVINNDEEDISQLALAVILNLCEKNQFVLQILHDKVDINQFQQSVTLEQYGILACKIILLMSNIDHELPETDIRNFFNFFNKQIPSAVLNLDTTSIRHVTSFFEHLGPVAMANDVRINFCFEPIVSAVEKFLADTSVIEGDKKYCLLEHLFGLAEAIVSTKNQSFHAMFDKLIESAMDFIQVKSSSCEAIRLCHTILKTIISEKKKNVSYDVNPKSMVQIIRKVLTHASVCPKTIIAALKLVEFLKAEYDIDILTESYVESILEPLNAANIKYTDIHSDIITMYLQCLSTVSGILDAEQSAAFFYKRNIQYIIGMSIKFGDKDQIYLALDCVQRQKISISFLSEIISHVAREEIELMPQTLDNSASSSTMLSIQPSILSNTNGMDKSIKHEVTLAIKSIDTANKENRLHQQNLSDFLKVFQAQIAVLKQKNKAQKAQISELMARTTTLTQTESVNMNLIENLSELITSMQSSNEKLGNELAKKSNENSQNMRMLKTSLAQVNELKGELKESVDQIEELKRIIQEREGSVNQMKKSNCDLQARLKQKEQRILDLEKEIELNEDTRSKIMHLMAKQKITGNRK